MAEEKIREEYTSASLKRVTEERGKQNPACHPPNSVRFKCRCGYVHAWPYDSRGHVYECKICGRLHGHQYGAWDYPSFGSKYGRDGCPGFHELRRKRAAALERE